MAGIISYKQKITLGPSDPQEKGTTMEKGQCSLSLKQLLTLLKFINKLKETVNCFRSAENIVPIIDEPECSNTQRKLRFVFEEIYFVRPFLRGKVLSFSLYFFKHIFCRQSPTAYKKHLKRQSEVCKIYKSRFKSQKRPSFRRKQKNVHLKQKKFKSLIKKFLLNFKRICIIHVISME